MGDGVRNLTLRDIKPNCPISLNKAYTLVELIVPGMQIADIGCGAGPLQSKVESLGGRWIGVEPFTREPHILASSAEHLPFENSSFDIVIMNAVLEHFSDVSKAFSEVSRVLKSGGC